MISLSANLSGTTFPQSTPSMISLSANLSGTTSAFGSSSKKALAAGGRQGDFFLTGLAPGVAGLARGRRLRAASPSAMNANSRHHLTIALGEPLWQNPMSG